MFQTVPLSIIRSLFTVHSAMVYLIQVCTWLSSRTRMEQVPSWSCSKAVLTVPVWYTPLLSVQWVNSWWWAEEPSETFRVSCQNKFVKLVLLAGFIIEKFTTVCFFTLQIVLIVYEVFLPGRVLFACYTDHRYRLYIIVIKADKVCCLHTELWLVTVTIEIWIIQKITFFK
jgi:hypothetical protein